MNNDEMREISNNQKGIEIPKFMINNTNNSNQKITGAKTVKRGKKLRNKLRNKERDQSQRNLRRGFMTAALVALTCTSTFYIGNKIGRENATTPGVTIETTDEGKDTITIDLNKTSNQYENSDLDNLSVTIKDINGLEYTISGEDVSTYYSLARSTSNKISSLDNHDEVMDYLKQLFVDEYNKSNDQEIDVDDVSLNVNVPSVRGL